MTDQPLQTEFEFTLPRGYVDEDGTLHREGRMRLATAADEIQPLSDPHVQSNSSYLTIALLARVVTELGSLERVDIDVIENLFVADLEYLQAMYERVNNEGHNAVPTACPDCGESFDVAVETGTPLAEGVGGDIPEAIGSPAADDADASEADGAGESPQPAEVDAGNSSE